MRDLRKRVKNLPLFLFDFLKLSLSVFHDYSLKIKVLITRENFTGRYVSIMNGSERRMMFRSCIAGGYTGFVLIKLFATPNCSSYEECVEELLVHESLHQVLSKVAGHEARVTLDNVHKSFYTLDCNTNQWAYILRFINEKKGKITII